MKNIKIKYILIFALILILPLTVVDAGAGIPATRGQGVAIDGTSAVKYSFCGRTSGSFMGSTKTYRYPITIGDKNYDAFCIDPGNTTPSKQLQCSLLKDEGLTYLFEQRKAGVDDATFNIALRLYALDENLIILLGQDASGKLNYNYQKAAFIQFEQVDSGMTSLPGCGSNYSTNKWNYLYEQATGQGKEPTGILKKAYELYQQAKTHPGYSGETLASGVTFTNKVYKTGTAEHYIQSSTPLTKEDLGEPECENCTIVSFDWSGTSGVITVAAECDKDYKVSISSMDKGVYACNGIGDNTQTLLMLAEEDTENSLADDGKIPCTGDPTCCTTGTQIDPGHIEGTVHNCCEDGGNSEAHEYNLDDLFCKDEDLLVDYYYPKCKTDYYIEEDTDLNEKYCQMYCTERVSVEIPGSITATSGRYFELSTTSKGTKSPYVEGFKRCRIRVQYDVWEKDYGDIVNSEITNYNKYQENEAWRQTYQDAVDHVSRGLTTTVQLKFTASCSQEKPKSCPTCTDECDVSVSRSTTVSATVKYDKYPFSKFLDWYKVELNTTKKNNYEAYEIEKSTKVGRTKAYYSDNWSAYNFDYSNVNSIKSNYEGKTAGSETNGRCSCTATWSYQGYELSDAEKHSENVEGKLASYTSNATSAANAYNSAIAQAKKLEEDIDKCDNYFTKYKGANAAENYEFDASMDFYYTQVYMDNEKGLQLDEQYITFKDTPGCVITGPTAGPDSEDGLAGKRYSTIYSKAGDFERLKDFGVSLSLNNLQVGTNGYERYLDAEYNAEKIFTHDAKYHAICSWDEGEDVYYTLSPNGGASENTDVINFTEHGQEYRLFLSTLDGTYETYWRLVGLGSRVKGTSKGKFDDFFMEQGNTCADESPSATAMFTCKLHVEYEIVLTGYCNGSNGTDTTIDPADCDPYNEGYNLFSFKVVDPTNLFPNGYGTDAGEVGYNWSSTDKGQAALKEIESIGKADKTYHRDYLSYSFILSPTDMGHIKNYNVEANAEGGYSDFKMDCSCSGDSCVNCKSRFLTELANGNVTYDGTSHSVTGWGNQQNNLDGIRRQYGW